MSKDKSSLPNGTDNGNDNAEEIKTWESLRIIDQGIEALMDDKTINVEEVEIWEPLRIILKDEEE